MGGLNEDKVKVRRMGMGREIERSMRRRKGSWRILTILRTTNDELFDFLSN